MLMRALQLPTAKEYFEHIRSKCFVNEKFCHFDDCRPKLVEIMYGDANINVTDKELYNKLSEGNDSQRSQFSDYICDVKGKGSHEDKELNRTPLSREQNGILSFALGSIIQGSMKKPKSKK
jgi:hypothetical protein